MILILTNILNFFLKKPSNISVVSYQLKSNFGILDIDKNNYVKNFREKPTLDIWYNVGYILLSRDNFKLFNKFSNFKNFLKFLSKNKKMRSFKHLGNHITINTIQELENARSQIKKFNLNEKKINFGKIKIFLLLVLLVLLVLILLKI